MLTSVACNLDLVLGFPFLYSVSYISCNAVEAMQNVRSEICYYARLALGFHRRKLSCDTSTNVFAQRREGIQIKHQEIRTKGSRIMGHLSPTHKARRGKKSCCRSENHRTIS